MNINVLGASGGIGGLTGSTCVQVDEQIIIDAGTGVTQLLLKQMQQLRHIFISHSHSDHVACLPMLLANLYGLAGSDEQVVIYGSDTTLAALREHVFNWTTWPDMTTTQGAVSPFVRFQEISAGEVVSINGISIRAFATFHTVPTLAFAITKHDQLSVFVTDTGFADSLIDELNGLGPIDDLILECSFPNELVAVAEQSRHLTPQLCLEIIARLNQQPGQIWINHLKPDVADEIHRQLRAAQPPQGWQVLL